jgi:ribosome-associated toxin RatA of RatAB toxin-antitoxin module
MRVALATVSTLLATLSVTVHAWAQTVPTATPAAGIRVEAITLPGVSVPAGRATAEFAVPFSAVESVINDFGHYQEFLPQVQQSRVVHRRHNQVELYVQVRLLRNLGTLWALTRFDVQRTADGMIANGALLEGNIRRFDLRIEAHMIPGTANTSVSLMLLGLPAFFMPNSVLAQQQSQWAERALTAMRQRAEATARSQRASR